MTDKRTCRTNVGDVMEAGNRLCTWCCERAAEFFCTCQDSETYLCSECLPKHSKIKAANGHATWPISDLFTYKNPRCAECRDQAAELFCTCNSSETLLCPGCLPRHSKIRTPNGHPVWPISELSSYKKPSADPPQTSPNRLNTGKPEAATVKPKANASAAQEESKTVQLQHKFATAATVSSTPDIKLSGTVGYTLHFDTVNLRVGKISHTHKSSGSLQLVLWAVKNYTGGRNWSGTRVAKVQLDTLAEGEYYENVDQEATRVSPSAGTYTMIMSLESFTGGRFVMEDFRVFEKRKEVTCDVKMKGSTGYSISGDSVKIRVERIAHNYSNGTGSLMLLLWACSRPAVNGEWSGKKLAEVTLDPLEAEYYYTNVKRTVDMKKIASGNYYLILQLKSYEDGEWVQKDYKQFDGLIDL